MHAWPEARAAAAGASLSLQLSHPLCAALILSLSFSLPFSLCLSRSLSLFVSPSLPAVNNGLNSLGTRPFRRLGVPGQDSSPAAPQASAVGRMARRTQGPAPGPPMGRGSPRLPPSPSASAIPIRFRHPRGFRPGQDVSSRTASSSQCVVPMHIFMARERSAAAS